MDSVSISSWVRNNQNILANGIEVIGGIKA